MVKDLRTKTGAGMMDCKKALVEADGDVEKAVDILREKGLSQAAKKASRVAAEGAVVSAISEDGKTGTIVEVNCETDFVGSNDDFKALAHSIAQQIIAVNPADVDALLASEMNGKSVKDTVTEAVAKIGENISVRRFVRYESAEGKVYSYIHGGGKIGVLVELKGGDDELGKDIAMQVAAANPSYLDRSEVPQAEIEHEKEGLDTDLYYVGNGNLIKTVNEVSKEKRSSYMPVASDIQIWIKQKYPDATIIVMDNEKGKLVVDILDGGKAKELIFQGNDWLSTSWEVSKAEVPSVVMETFRHSNFGKYRIDDIHFYETPNNSYYYFDLEQGNSEVHLSIDPTGNILQ